MTDKDLKNVIFESYYQRIGFAKDLLLFNETPG